MLNEGRYLHSVVRASSTKVDISILENERWTALHLASAYGVQEIVEALIGAGADVSCSHLESPTPPAMAAVNNHVPVIRLLRDHGADMDSGEFPPIWQAVMKGRQDAVEALLDLNAYSGSGAAELNEALRIASARGNQSLIEVLLDRRASLSSQDGNGRTALHYALSGMHIAVADVLVDRGANPLIEDNIGSTPLDLVVVHGMAAADFIHRHMGELTASISRRPSLLEAMGKQSSQAAPAIRKMISGTWTGFFEHLSWIKGTQQSFSISIPESDPNDTRQATFSSQLEHDEIGDFHFHGFVDQIGVVWFVKLYKRHGWLYRGQLNTDRRHMRGTWGSNRKLWFGTFELNLDA
ncbi:ankyrin [Polyplosphaeria fusca]|uniref:Ankyrin n=1 Tax=Polyplosphaeria fusca TaxID=682080 RepID=A0A9P4QRT4_9PLEO|nr:ankyrin [Polyplosphaeria fusca]